MVSRQSKFSAGRRRGNAMLVAILFSAITISSAVAYLSVVSREIPQQAKRLDRNRVLELADAGLEHALWRINVDQDWWQTVCEDFVEGEQTDDAELFSPGDLFEDGEQYEVDIDHLTDTASGRPTFFIQATGIITRPLPDGREMQTLKTMAVMTRPEGFADYARFVASGNLTYGAGAVLDGKVHTNGNLDVTSGTVDRPIIFRRKVSTSGTVYGNVPNEVFFYDDLETGVPTVPLPESTDTYATLAQNGGIYYAPADPATSVSLDLSSITYPADFNGIIYCTKDIKVHGTPTRPVTLVSNDDVYITDHIHQGYDPRHVVGLIAKDYIYLDYSTPDNLQINAALLSINSSWKALGSGSKYGLTIQGSIVTKYGGSAGPYMAGERHYNYDRRLLYYMPPEFPDFPGGSYVLTAWIESPGETTWQTSGLVPPDIEGLLVYDY